MTNAEMPAAVIQQYATSPTYLSFPRPTFTPGQGQALVRVLAAPISPLDLLCATGTSYFGPPALPYIPGVQGIGMVEEADTLPPGQRIWFNGDAGMKPGNGSMALYCLIKEENTLALPEGISDDAAASLGLSAIAGWMALTWRGNLQPGEQVLVLGASGAVGQVAVQAARILGARRVIAAARSEKGREQALKQGADAVVDLSGDDLADLTRRIEAACEGPLHLVIDPVWGLPVEAALRSLGNNGRLVNIGSSAGAVVRFESALVRSRLHNILGYTNNGLTGKQKSDALAEILKYAAEGRLSVARESFPLSQVAEGWERQAKTAYHKIILVPG
jgi:NADPH:quinone reductase-like Zn-dependent oxidoreductase